MKTTLPASITTVDEAKAFLRALHSNGEAFHPDDDAHEVHNGRTDRKLFTHEEAIQINKLRDDIYALPGNAGVAASDMAFDPCAFLLSLDHEHKRFLWIDKSGRGFRETVTWDAIADDADTLDWDTEQCLADWSREAEIGDEFETRTEKYTRTA